MAILKSNFLDVQSVLNCMYDVVIRPNVGQFHTQFKAVIVNCSHDNDILVNRDIVLVNNIFAEFSTAPEFNIFS